MALFGSRRRHRAAAGALTARRGRPPLVAGCLVVLLAAATRIALHDPTSEPVSGDQASFVYQALSLQGGDLAYSAEDQARWLELGWTEQPHGLFLQRREDGWAFAKPLGYSVLLAPAIAVAGPHGITIVGAALLLAYAGCWYAIGRQRWGRPSALAVATAASVASHAWLYGFPAHADLFVAVLVGLAALGALRVAWPSHPDGPVRPGAASALGATSLDPPVRRGARSAVGATSVGGATVVWLAVAAGASALLVTEKLPALVAVGPLLALALWRAPWRARLVAGAVGLVVLAGSVAPYLFYSDGESSSAYGGDRYYALPTTPWSGGTEADLTPWRTRDSLTPSFLLDQITDPSGDIPAAAATYAIGRHTGVLTFQPVVAALLATAVVCAAVAWWRLRGARRTVSGAPLPQDEAGSPQSAQGSTDQPRGPGRAQTGGPPLPGDPSQHDTRSPQSAPTSAHQPASPGRAQTGGPPLSDDPLRQDDTGSPQSAQGSTPASTGSRRSSAAPVVALLAGAGLVGYAVLYLVAFTDNYFGGGQSIGSRYFLQVSALAAVVAVAAPVSARAARWCAAFAAVWAVVVLHPHLRSPEEAFSRIDRTSAAQRLLPFEDTQVHAWRFRCEPAACAAPALEVYE